MKQEKTFPLELYRSGIKVFFGGLDDFKASAKRDRLDNAVADECERKMENAQMVTLSLTNGDAVIYGKDVPRTIAEKAVLQHEIFHAASHLLRSVGIDHTADTEEAYAYVIEDFTLRVFTWLSSLSP